MKSKFTTKKIAIYGVLMALTTMTTMVISIPSIATSGYVNLGDAFVLFSGLILGPSGGFIVGGVGSAMADILLSYPHYAIFTLIIKGIEGSLVIILYEKFLRKKLLFVVSIIAGLWMSLGYFFVEMYMYSIEAAITDLPGNMIQGLVGALIAVIIYRFVGLKIKDKLIN